MDLFSILAEERIKQAQREKQFDHLPGAGKPLPKDELASVPENVRMAYRIMKNAGYTSEESEIKLEMIPIKDLIKACETEEAKKQLNQELNEKILKYNRLLSKRKINTNSSVFKNYEEKINNKLL
ncbi:DUF1992 domain-containing protein [Cytobacillus horneckiae]|uniref:DnaJ family domain-containing protein n=1 Tax=Cytobacillus horneckiae TaxID=549687 RepID=UPI003D224CF6